jgi:hypothetical protein
MWFCAVKEMTDNFFWHASTSIRGRIFVSARIRADYKLKWFLCFILIDVTLFRVTLKMSSLTLEDTYSRFKTTVLNNQLTSGGTMVELTRRSSFSPITHFCYRSSRTQGHSPTGRIRKIKTSPMTSSGFYPATYRLCSITPQPTTPSVLPHPPPATNLI